MKNEQKKCIVNNKRKDILAECKKTALQTNETSGNHL